MKHAKPKNAKDRALAELKSSANEVGFAPAGAPARMPDIDGARAKGSKKKGRGKIVVLLLVLAALVAAGVAGASWYLTQQAEQRMRDNASKTAAQVFERVPEVAKKTGEVKARVDSIVQKKTAEVKARQAEEQARREALINEARQRAVDEARAAAIEKAHQEAIEAARAEYEARIEEERARRASDFSDTILFGDSIMQNSQGALSAAMPGVTINAMGGRALEIGPIGAGSDPNDGVLDHIRADTGGYRRYVIGTGNNDAGGMSLAAGEEIVSHIGPDKDIYFVTEYVGGNLGGTAATNATIAELAARYENVHAIGWYELVSGDPGSYLSDGCHPLASAMSTYANLIRDAICNVEEKPFDPESVEFDPNSVEFDESTVEFDPASVDFGEGAESQEQQQEPKPQAQ